MTTSELLTYTLKMPRYSKSELVSFAGIYPFLMQGLAPNVPNKFPLTLFCRGTFAADINHQ